MGRLSDKRPAIGFYVSIIRNAGRPSERRGLLLGPYPARSKALALVWRGRQLAREADARASFDAFGTAKYTAVDGEELPVGVLNERLARAERADATWPTPEADDYLMRLRAEGKSGYAWDVWDALVLGEPLPPVNGRCSTAAARQVEARLAPMAAVKRSTAPCTVCGRGGRHFNHGARGHAYAPAHPEDCECAGRGVCEWWNTVPLHARAE